jgi:hypothetical protein
MYKYEYPKKLKMVSGCAFLDQEKLFNKKTGDEKFHYTVSLIREVFNERH